MFKINKPSPPINQHYRYTLDDGNNNKIVIILYCIYHTTLPIPNTILGWWLQPHYEILTRKCVGWFVFCFPNVLLFDDTSRFCCDNEDDIRSSILYCSCWFLCCCFNCRCCCCLSCCCCCPCRMLVCWCFWTFVCRLVFVRDSRKPLLKLRGWFNSLHIRSYSGVLSNCLIQLLKSPYNSDIW